MHADMKVGETHANKRANNRLLGATANERNTTHGAKIAMCGSIGPGGVKNGRKKIFRNRSRA